VTERPLIVTRPGAAGERLAADLRAAGCDALWLPAFAFGAAPDAARARAALARLADYDLAVFVSPAAVAATAALLARPWPPQTAIAAVGAATKREVLARIAGADAATIHAPAAADESGSEALWAHLQAGGCAFRRALILRAEHGREWLAERLQAAGVQVRLLAVYTRRIAAPEARALATLRAWMQAGRAPAVLVTSSEAVDALAAQLEADLACWLRAGRALATHERIAQRLRAAGFADVRVVAADVAALVRACAQ
jgi:uroporphyrinogen-III synthase